MAITAAERREIVELTVMMFNAAPGAEYLSQIVALYEANPGTPAQKLQALANQLATTAVYRSMHPNFETAEEFAASFLTPLGLQNDAVAKDFIIAKVNAGVSKGQIAYEAYVALNAVPSTGAAQYVAANAILNNKTTVAEYYSVTADGRATDLSTLQNVVASVTATQASVDAAIATISGTAGGGTTFTLTAGADTIVGTAGNDIINAVPVNASGTAATTLGSFDNIDGSAGVDTLNIYATAAGNTSLSASVTVKNVEVVNILNDGVVFHTGTAGTVDASLFGSAVTQLWQVGAEASVTKLGAASTAGFRGVTDATLNVAGATTAATVSVALDAVKEAATVTGDNNITLNTTGLALNTVNVSGTLAAGAATGDKSKLTLNIEAGKDQQTVTLNTSTAATVTLAENGASTKKVNTLNAAASTAAVTFAGDVDVKSVTTGSGNDKVTLNYTATAAAQTAHVGTGAGKDTITVSTSDGGYTGFVVHVDAGAGDDTVVLTNGLHSLGSSDVVNGGDGKDTISFAGATFIAGDYEVISAGLTSFEAVKFTGGTAAVVDASRMVGYKDFTFAGNSGDKITKVAADMNLTTAGYLTATAAGYVAPADADTASTLAGTLNITAKGTGYITAQAATLNLAVLAQEDADANAWVDSNTSQADVGTATITVTNAVNAAGTGTYIAYADFEAYKNSADLTSTSNANVNATSLTLKGDGIAYVWNGVGTKLATVDASAMGGTYAQDVINTGWSFANWSGGSTAGESKGDTVSSLYYETGNSGVAETVTLGSGIDVVYFYTDTTLTGKTNYGSTVLKTDTINNFNLVADATGLAVDFAKTDIIQISGLSTFAKTVVTGSTLGIALNSLAATATDNAVFVYGGNTYIYVDGGVSSGSIDTATPNDLLDDTDVLVKLTGTYDLDLLVDVLG